MTGLLVAFLAVHGLLHLAIWLPHPESDPAKPPPFRPDRSTVLARVHVPPVAVRQLSVGLAAGTAAAYLLAALAVALDQPWAAPVTIAAALLGLALKVVFFHPWLLIGIALDGMVLAAVLTDRLGLGP